jgi:CDP-diglyceride synthetase
LLLIGFKQISFAGGQLAGLGAIEQAMYWGLSIVIVFILFLVFRQMNESSTNRNYSFFVYMMLLIIAVLFFIPIYFIFEDGFGRSLSRHDVNWVIVFGILFVTAVIAMIQTYKKDRAG